MKVLLGIFLTVSFLGIAGFGLTAIDHGAPLHQGLTGCLASLLTGSACSENFSPYAAALFHLNAFKNFVTAIPSFALWLFTFSAFALLFVAFSSRYTLHATRYTTHAFQRDTKSLTNAPLVIMQRLRWLSHLEMRDPSLR